MERTRKSLVRDSARKAVLVRGTIAFGEQEFDCVVLNLSARGASLSLETDTTMPFAFDLAIDGERRQRRCRVIWRIDRQLGISFDIDQREDTTHDDRCLAG
jgi:hypothetical protein